MFLLILIFCINLFNINCNNINKNNEFNIVRTNVGDFSSLAVSGATILSGTLKVAGKSILAETTMLGITNINTSNSNITTIGTGGTGAVIIGNATGNTSIIGNLTISGIFSPLSISTKSLNVIGTTNINTTESFATNIGNNGNVLPNNGVNINTVNGQTVIGNTNNPIKLRIKNSIDGFQLYGLYNFNKSPDNISNVLFIDSIGNVSQVSSNNFSKWFYSGIGLIGNFNSMNVNGNVNLGTKAGSSISIGNSLSGSTNVNILSGNNGIINIVGIVNINSNGSRSINIGDNGSVQKTTGVNINNAAGTTTIGNPNGNLYLNGIININNDGLQTTNIGNNGVVLPSFGVNINTVSGTTFIGNSSDLIKLKIKNSFGGLNINGIFNGNICPSNLSNLLFIDVFGNITQVSLDKFSEWFYNIKSQDGDFRNMKIFGNAYIATNPGSSVIIGNNSNGATNINITSGIDGSINIDGDVNININSIENKTNIGNSLSPTIINGDLFVNGSLSIPIIGYDSVNTIIQGCNTNKIIYSESTGNLILKTGLSSSIPIFYDNPGSHNIILVTGSSSPTINTSSGKNAIIITTGNIEPVINQENSIYIGTSGSIKISSKDILIEGILYINSDGTICSKKILNDIKSNMDNGNNINYSAIILFLLKYIKDNDEKINNLKNELDEIKIILKNYIKN